MGGTVHCLSHPDERLPTSTVKEQIFSFDKAENTETVYMYVYVFQTDPRVVFSVADVLACHRAMVLYSDNAGVVFSVTDFSLTIDGSQLTVAFSSHL